MLQTNMIEIEILRYLSYSGSMPFFVRPVNKKIRIKRQDIGFGTLAGLKKYYKIK